MDIASGDLNELGRRPSGFVSGDMTGSVAPSCGFVGGWQSDGLSVGGECGDGPAQRSSDGVPAPQRGGDLRDGLYHGGSVDFAVHLRIDTGVSRILSGDIFANMANSALVWLASFRTPPSVPFSPFAESWTVIATDRADAVSGGRIRLRPLGDVEGQLQGELTFEVPLEGLPWGRPILLGLRWETAAMRRLGLEIEQEDGVEPPPETMFGGSPMTIQQALANAGFETWAAGTSSRLPPPPPRVGEQQAGWSEKDLEGLMNDHSETELNRPAMELHLLWLSRSNRPGLLGVMFDSEDAMPRQGLAVFAEEIREIVGPTDASRKLIQTTVHEIGHALNLAHRFERAVGRADSASFMNYDWRYAGGSYAGNWVTIRSGGVL